MADEIPRITIRIPRSGLREIAIILKHSDKLEEIRSVNRSLGVNASLTEIIEACATKSNIPASEIREVLVGLQNMYSLMVRFNLSPPEFCVAMTTSLEEQTPEPQKKELLKAWGSASGKIGDALRSMGPDEPIAINQKARQLAFSHQNVLTESSIITDVRPVFNFAGTEILRFLVTHMLLIDFQVGDKTERIELAIDSEDLKRLAEQCERARIKTSTIATRLKALEVPTVIVPEKEG